MLYNTAHLEQSALEERADWFVTIHYYDALFRQHHTARFDMPNKKKWEALSGARLEWLELYDSELDRNEGVGLWMYGTATAEKGGES